MWPVPVTSVPSIRAASIACPIQKRLGVRNASFSHNASAFLVASTRRQHSGAKCVRYCTDRCLVGLPERVAGGVGALPRQKRLHEKRPGAQRRLPSQQKARGTALPQQPGFLHERSCFKSHERPKHLQVYLVETEGLGVLALLHHDRVVLLLLLPLPVVLRCRWRRRF